MDRGAWTLFRYKFQPQPIGRLPWPADWSRLRSWPIGRLLPADWRRLSVYIYMYVYIYIYMSINLIVVYVRIISYKLEPFV